MIFNCGSIKPISGRKVTVYLTNPRNPSSFSRCELWQALSSDPYDTGLSLGTINSPTGSAEVEVPGDVYGIIVYCSGGSVGGGSGSGTGGVTFAETDYMGWFSFEVTGDGTATIDGVDYDD